MDGLILETSTEKGLLILSREGKPLAAKRLTGGHELSKKIASEVSSLLEENAFQPQFVAVGTGPGSFTGTRVGAALGKALAFGWKIPVLGFCSLEAFFPTDQEPCAVVFDAKMGGFYVLKKSFDTPLLIPLVKAAEDFGGLARIASPHPDLLKKRLDIPAPIIETDPNPFWLCTLCNDLFSKEVLPPCTLTYLDVAKS